MLILNITKGLYMSQNKSTVVALVFQDLRSKVEQGFTVDQIKAISNGDIEAYCLYFRHKYASQLKTFKDGTVNRYVEQWIKANKAV